MHQSSSTYRPTTANATLSAAVLRFSYAGREKDFETGLSYIGARYYDADLTTGWLSVDPMADKSPSMSPYNYCTGNPVKLVDPDGRLVDDYFSQDGEYLGFDNAITHNVRIIPKNNWSELPKVENDVVTDNQIGHDLSYSFSDVSSNGNMDENAQLKVYQHYNPTEKILTNNDDGKKPGMTTVVSKDKQGSTCIRLMIKLKPNYTKDKAGWALCDNADEIINCFIHEKNHIDRAKAMGYYRWRNLKNSNPYDIEESAVNAQKSHESWSDCSETFKMGAKNT